MKRNYDYSKLRGRIIEKLGNLKNYAELEAVEVSHYFFTQKVGEIQTKEKED